MTTKTAVPTKTKQVSEEALRTITIPVLNTQIIGITIVGDSPLVTHRWSEKAKKEMLDKQMKKAKTAKVAKDPWMEFCSSMYWLDGMPKKPTQEDVDKARFGFRSVSLKKAAVTACTQIDGMTKVAARQAFHVEGEMVEIQSSEPPRMREDLVRVGMGTADLRYRGEWLQWAVTFQVSYNADFMSAEQIVNLFQHAGFGVGILEDRPEKGGGSWGRFHVLTTE